MSWNRWPVRSLYSAIMPSSKSRPTLSIECRKARWKAITSLASRCAIPRASASLRRKSIARGRSTSFGQRVTQVSQPTHSQSVRARRILFLVLRQLQLEHAQDPRRGVIHLARDGAARAALAALVAVGRADSGLRARVGPPECEWAREPALRSSASPRRWTPPRGVGTNPMTGPMQVSGRSLAMPRPAGTPAGLPAPAGQTCVGGHGRLASRTAAAG